MPNVRKIIRLAVLTALVAGAMGCYSIGCECKAKVRNNTPFYMHLLGPIDSHIYVPPGGQNYIDLEGAEEPELRALIAPGQGITAEIVVPLDCSSQSCRLTDICWEDSFLVVRRLDCPSGIDASIFDGG